MVRVAPIKLQVGPKVLWFDPAEFDIRMGDEVIVSTSRGLEYGIATSDVVEVSDQLIADLKSPLKPVVRIATEEDKEKVAELEQKSNAALKDFKEIAAETNKDMHPIMVEYLFEGDKAVFYFEAEERVDFRELVRRLASFFHVRVDMRQIGVRDGASIIGGLGHCGQELCCTRLGGEFSPVSIRMAKEQNLSLNPQKISGCCGRLMCCLRYEYDAYKEFNSRAPKIGAKIEIPDGIARVVEINVPSELISIRLEDNTIIKVPLSDFEKPEEGRRPHAIRADVFEELVEASKFDGLGSANLIDVVNFTDEDTLASPRPVREEEVEVADNQRRRRRNRGANSNGANGRSRNGAPEGSRNGAREGTRNGVTRRPGQKSSGLSGLRSDGQAGSNGSHSNKPPRTAQSPQGSQAGAGSATPQRRARRRSHTTGGE